MTRLEAVLVVLLVVVGAGLSILYYKQLGEYSRLESEYNMLQSRYITLNTDYTSLSSQYQALEENYTSLLNQYNNLSSRYNSLEASYNNVTSLLGGVLRGMGGNNEGPVQPGGYGPAVGILVPLGCNVTATISVDATGLVYVYVMDLPNVINWLIDGYALTVNMTPPYNYTAAYYFNGTRITQTVVLTPGLINSGDIYTVLVYNPNPYPVTAYVYARVDQVTCTTH